MSNTNVTTVTPEMKTIQKNKKKSITFTRVQEVKIGFDEWLNGLEKEINDIAAEKLWSTMVTDTCGAVDVEDDTEDTDWAVQALEEATDDAREEEEEENDNGVACERCEKTTCEEDTHYNVRLLWKSNKTGKNICRGCVGVEDMEDE